MLSTPLEIMNIKIDFDMTSEYFLNVSLKHDRKMTPGFFDISKKWHKIDLEMGQKT